MAYNVLKGAVEGSVDQHADQEISGVKIFKNTISASVFYDTDAASPCATLKDVALTKIVGGSRNSLLTFQQSATAHAHHNLTFDGETLATPCIVAGKLTGNASGLRSIPTAKLDARVTAEQIQTGAGLTSVRGDLQVKCADGLSAAQDGVGISLSQGGGLAIRNKNVVVAPSKSQPVTTNGQNLSGDDVVLVEDVSRSALVHTTLNNLYDAYIKHRISHAHGNIHEVQLKGKTGFSSSPKLSYNADSHILRVDGRVAAAGLQVDGEMKCNGAVVKNIKQITERAYEPDGADYTILCDTIDNPIDVILPPACNNVGRVLIIKKANSQKYKINSHSVKVRVHEGTIDLTDEMVLKTNYSVCSVQSDGNKWWVLNSKGN